MTKPIEIQVWNAVLAELNRLLEQPTDAIPSVQVLTETNLRNCLRIAKDAAAGAKSWKIVRLLDLLKQSGLGSLIPLDGLQDKVPAVRLWRIGFGAMPAPDALELLQAAKPQGIVCYFSALSHHELTTQEPSHHHIALFRRKAPAELPAVVTPPSGIRVKLRDNGFHSRKCLFHVVDVVCAFAPVVSAMAF